MHIIFIIHCANPFYHWPISQIARFSQSLWWPIVICVCKLFASQPVNNFLSENIVKLRNLLIKKEWGTYKKLSNQFHSRHTLSTDWRLIKRKWMKQIICIRVQAFYKSSTKLTHECIKYVGVVFYFVYSFGVVGILGDKTWLILIFLHLNTLYL